jgi:hypothetical protein
LGFVVAGFVEELVFPLFVPPDVVNPVPELLA